MLYNVSKVINPAKNKMHYLKLNLFANFHFSKWDGFCTGLDFRCKASAQINFKCDLQLCFTRWGRAFLRTNALYKQNINTK